ncbi:hypothetical protein V493_01767 [Pseudogymnoascus sp. VKM F-4281 (FW-2241)]|nr:hypothetical protein V493_01767 [Pseudogymnoascus sp. VKM F-4281 (FW-2241)]
MQDISFRSCGWDIRGMSHSSANNALPARRGHDLGILHAEPSLASVASAITVSYDTGYDDRARSLTAVSCSNGENGLITRKNWHTQGEIPVFPYIGGAQAVEGWNSVNCGTCWRLDYNGKSINVIAIDHTDAGFNIALEAMNVLTDGHAVELGRVEAAFTQIDGSICAMETIKRRGWNSTPRTAVSQMGTDKWM